MKPMKGLPLLFCLLLVMTVILVACDSKTPADTAGPATTASTEAPTDAPTEAPTEATTDAPEETTAETPDASETTSPEDQTEEETTAFVPPVADPEDAAAAEIARVLRFPSAIKIDTFAKGRVELLKFRMPDGSRLVGMSVKDVISKLGCDVLVCTVERGDEAFIANGDFVFAEKDIISIIASPKNAAEFFKKIDYQTDAVKDVIVVGGGEIAQYLCRLLRRSGISVKIIERDRRLCEELCVELPDVSIIHGDASDQSLLLEEGVRGAGAFVALTGLDEENIFLSLFAKSVGCGKVVTKINRIDFDDVIKHLDMDSTIYPKNITADIIIRYVRAMKNSVGSNMETLYNVIKGKVEAAEFTVRAGSPVLDTPLMKLSFKPNVLIAALIRDGQVIIPRGADMIREGDRVVVVSRVMALNDISDILN